MTMTRFSFPLTTSVRLFARGESLEAAIGKMQREVTSYLNWRQESPIFDASVEIVQEKISDLHIRDADSDVIFDDEKNPLTLEEYFWLKELTLTSASDFHRLYSSVPDPDVSCMPRRISFHGQAPTTAREMYEHTKSVNEYYFAEIGVHADNDGTIYECRQRGFDALEQKADFLNLPVIEGSYGELWSLRKVLRRFVWHDRIHARAMYRMALKTFGKDSVDNVFSFIEAAAQD